MQGNYCTAQYQTIKIKEHPPNPYCRSRRLSDPHATNWFIIEKEENDLDLPTNNQISSCRDAHTDFDI